MCRYKILISLFFLVFCCMDMDIYGQEHAGNWYDFDFIKDSNPWLVVSNAAGLTTLQVDRTSFVDAYFEKNDGGLIPVEGSDDCFASGIGTESFVRVSDKIAFHGMLSYSYFQGKNMNGHYFMSPSYNPINFLESTEDNPGVKVREMYSLLGGISYTFSDRLSAGMQVSYETGDYAKRKDPRPRSRWMSLDLTGGIRFAASDRFSAGLNLLYLRTTENLDCSIFGTTDQQYYTFVDYGGYFGTIEGLDGDLGYVKTTSPGRPMVNTFYGGSVQLSFGSEDDILFFNQLTYRHRYGHYGENSSNDVVYCNFGGNGAEYEGFLDIHGNDNIHRVSLFAGYSRLSTNENIYRRTTSAGGNTVVEYFGQNEINSSIEIDGRISYTAYLGISDFRPKWEIGAALNASYRTLRATYFPYYRDQTVTRLNADIHGKRSFFAGRNIFTVNVAAGPYMGFGVKNSDGAYVASESSNLRTDDVYLNKDFEYDTALRVYGTLAFRYTRLFKKMNIYVDLRDTYNHTLKKPEFLVNGFRNAFTVTLGCAF